MKVITNHDFEEIYRWICPLCGHGNEDPEPPFDGDVLQCSGCEKELKYENK